VQTTNLNNVENISQNETDEKKNYYIEDARS